MATEYYVSPEGDDDWSGTVPEPGEDDGPFRTIEAAQAAVRDAVAGGMEDDVVVSLRAGTYYRDEPLTFGPADSGRDGHEVVYRAYPGETPTVVGGRPVEGWEDVGADTYRAALDPDRTFASLFEDGERARVARFPDDEYLAAEGPVEDDPKRGFHYAAGDLPADLADAPDLQVHLWPGGPEGEWSWFTHTVDVDRIDPDERTVWLSAEANYEIGPGSRYYVQNDRSLLDAPGEFYVDDDASAVYYRPLGASIEGREIVAPTVDHLVEFRGASTTEPVRGIRIDGVELRVTDRPRELPVGGDYDPTGLVTLAHARDVTVANCHLHGGGLHGVFARADVQNLAVRGNWIHDLGHTGVQLSGDGRTRRTGVRKNRIANNHVHDTGRFVGEGSGIMLSDAANNEVAHNRVHHTSRYCISLKSTRPGVLLGKTHDGIEATPETVRELTHAESNVVEYNDVSHANLDSQDTGAIESWGGGPGNTIHNNRIHDTTIQFSFGFGLYLDDAADEYTVTRNVLHDLGATEEGRLRSAIYAKGVGNTFRDNVIADCDVDGGVFGSMKLGGEENRDMVVHHNVLANSGPELHLFRNWEDDRIAYHDHNLYYHPDGEYRFEGVPWWRLDDREGHPIDVETLADWREVFDGKFDGHSETADPQFVNPGAGDYRFDHGSPAHDLGIRGADVAAIGLTDEFRYVDPDDPLDAVFVTDGVSPGRAHHALSEGESVGLSVTCRTETGFRVDPDAVAFESDDPDVATVDDDGTVTARGEGVARVRATATRGDRSVAGPYTIVVE
jgi:hypothetical protein